MSCVPYAKQVVCRQNENVLKAMLAVLSAVQTRITNIVVREIFFVPEG